MENDKRELKNQELNKCSFCAFAITKISRIPLEYTCTSPYQNPIKCKFGTGVKHGNSH
jgi:hypothetical protein